MEIGKRFIDAKPLSENGWHLVKIGKNNVFLSSMSLADVPAVDAVEIVRCKCCEHYDGEFCWRLIIAMHPNHFCAYGERRSENG